MLETKAHVMEGVILPEANFCVLWGCIVTLLKFILAVL